MADPQVDEVLRVANELRDVRGMDRTARKTLIALLVRAVARLEPDAAAVVAEDARADLRKAIRSEP